jgi:hypothetical protein
MGEARRPTPVTALARPARSLMQPATKPSSEAAALRTSRPPMSDPVQHGPTDWVPKPPPPDWTVESEVRHRVLAREAGAVLRAWQGGGPKQLPNPWEVDTASRTRVAPRVARGTVGQAVATASTTAGPSRSRRQPRVALGSLVALLCLSCLGLAFWQLYWMLEATATGRAILDRMADVVASATALF